MASTSGLPRRHSPPAPYRLIAMTVFNAIRMRYPDPVLVQHFSLFSASYTLYHCSLRKRKSTDLSPRKQAANPLIASPHPAPRTTPTTQVLFQAIRPSAAKSALRTRDQLSQETQSLQPFVLTSLEHTSVSPNCTVAIGPRIRSTAPLPRRPIAGLELDLWPWRFSFRFRSPAPRTRRQDGKSPATTS